MIKESRQNNTNRGLITVATGEYNAFIPELIKSAQDKFNCHFYLFTDEPEKYVLQSDDKDDEDQEGYKNMTVIEVKHLGWPRMPLLRFELMHKYIDIFEETYLFMIDAESQFIKNIPNSVLDHRVGVLHRNIMRYRDEFNYESRKESTAYVHPREGEKYFACGFVGGHKREFKRMSKVISENIRTDIKNGIRAIWGDESHLNRYFIDNRPTLVLPPSYMCPQTNPYFEPFIIHRDKQFKRVNKEDAKKYLEVDPKDYELEL